MQKKKKKNFQRTDKMIFCPGKIQIRVQGFCTEELTKKENISY